MSENNDPNENAQNQATVKSVRSNGLIEKVSVGATLPNTSNVTGIQPTDIYPSHPALLRNVRQQKFADSWSKFWQFPLEFDPVVYAQDEAGGDISITLPALTDQRHVIEQILFSLPDDTASVLSITDGQDTIFQINVSMPANGGWDYVTFSPFRMQRVPNQPMTITLPNNAATGLASLMVNCWRF
jgi:hypothetical protein